MTAQTRALDIARLNMVRGDTLYVDNPAVVNNIERLSWRRPSEDGRTTQDVTLEHHPGADSQKVRAWVRHAGVQTFFGGLIGQALWARPGDGDRLGHQRGADASSA